MIPSRRQRYFRTSSPQLSANLSNSSAQAINAANMNVLEQAELVMEGGDPGDEQQVSHEEIVDDVTSEMVVDHHHHHQQHQQMRGAQMHHHYDERQSNTVYQVQSSQNRRPPVNRQMNAQRAPSYAQNPMDMVQKLQNKSIYLPTQRPQTRISPTGARIVSFAGRKRDNSEALPPGVKKMAVPRVQQQQKNLQPVKVVRLVPNAMRSNPTVAEHAIVEIEQNIKQTIENSKIDMVRVKELQHAELSQDEYHQMLSVILMELERANTAITSLTAFYRERQRHEKTVYEAREDAYAARIRQLETENRKQRDAILMLHVSKFNEASEQQHNPYRNEHMGQMMVEEPEDHVVIEGHVDSKSEYTETEEVPQEWIVEETVHMQGIDPEDHLVDEQQPEEEDQEHVEVKNKANIIGGEQFGNGGNRAN